MSSSEHAPTPTTEDTTNPPPPLSSLSPTQRSTLLNLHSRLETLRSPTERTRLIRDTYDAEIATHGPNSKLARRLQSGVWQGGAAGVGVGVGTAMGVGTVVGTVVGGVVSVPATLVGGVVGMAVGGVKGPMVKFGGKEGEDGTEGDGVEVGDGGRRKPRKIEVRSQRRIESE